MGGATMAQTNGQFVIKTADTIKDGSVPPVVTGWTYHYLSHNGSSLADVTTFDPAKCLWTSDNTYAEGGTNRNYYFMDGLTPKFLAAPTFAAGSDLTIVAQPPTSYLNNPEYQYYFYNWDRGLGRGVQYHGPCTDSTYCVGTAHHTWGDGQCWDVYWVSYHKASGTWKLSDNYYDLDSVPTGVKFYPVTITQHANDTTTLSGGLESLVGFEMEYQTPVADHGHQVTPSISDYQYSVIPAYDSYVFEGTTHNYYSGSDHGENTPDAVNSLTNSAASVTYAWSISGDGATYLSFDSGSDVTTSTGAAPTLYYRTSNDDGHKTATLTLTVTYGDGSKQTSTATVLVKTPCQNPPVHHQGLVVTYVGVTVSWSPTAEEYTVSWQKQGDPNWSSATVGDVTSYTITGLEYESTYNYKVKATCDGNTPTTYTFTTLEEPGLMVNGAIFGGGRMANVGGKTEVVVVNCDSIGAIYGGNDIAGSVLDTITSNHEAGFAGSNITLGVNLGGTYASYGTTPNDGSVRVGSVYGGGNGYYAYNGTSFVAATSSYTSETVAVDGHVNAMTETHQVGDAVWTNTSASPEVLNFPSISKTAIMVTNDKVKVDSIFGGAKNAFLTANSGNGSSITIEGGTILAVFGGNNWGGTQGYGKHYIEVNHTTINLTDSIYNYANAGYGRTFGIRNLFGGGNKVEGSTTDVHINGGQVDNVFAGGNAADIYKANVTVDCTIGADAGDHLTFGDTYSNAIASYASGTKTITPKADYDWNGFGGIYNVRTLYGGNNEAEMTRLPVITLKSGSVGTVYGGGNAGDMMAHAYDDGNGGTLTINGNEVQYGTHVVLDTSTVIVDYIYGGCRMSSVNYSTWVELKRGHVGTVYGGCNISGDVGSTRVHPESPNVPQTLEQQRVLGGTYVQAGAGGSNTDVIVHKDLFAGSNGYYNCSTDGIVYDNDDYFDDPEGQYAGTPIPTHNETNVIVSTGATIKGSVYAGGNLARVGFDDGTGFSRGYPELVGLASVHMKGGLVEGNVYGGGNMASIYGSNEVWVSGGTILLGLYGGNDRAGQVAEMSNRILPPEYTYASDGKTKLIGNGGLGVKTYVSVSDSARIGTVYGGGNGAYPSGSIQYCYEDDEPVQSNTFVDININGGALNNHGGHIGTVYGGGNGVTTWDGITVFFNVQNPVNDRNHVDTIFGGNNMGNLDLVPNILLLHGQTGTVYGGCNQGAMIDEGVTVEGYTNIGSYVRLRNTYQASADSTHTVNAIVSEAVYGGCRNNGVTHNSLVLVEKGDYTGVGLFGGSDISGTVSDTSRVVVNGGTVTTGNVFGGGNGNYDYDGHNVYTAGASHIPANLVATSNSDVTRPYSTSSRVDMLNGSANNLYAGGNACGSGTTVLQFEGGSVANGIYGGSNSSGNIDGTVEVNIVSGTLGTSLAPLTSGIFGGGYGPHTSTSGNVTVNIGVADAANAGVCPIIYSDIYGGSALGSVNDAPADLTQVNFLNGTLHGTLYGGGLGDVDYDTCGRVFGQVEVNISTETQNTANCFIDLRDADIYGCNNTNGSPQDDVTVNVWKTGYTIDDYDSQSGALYAIDEVFGGGNRADYLPENKLASSTKKATVIIHECLNSIRRVFGGGNAADATGVATTIEGGRFNYIFGGGNGEVANTEANIGLGGTHLIIEAGKINHLFGGSNTRGNIAGETYTEVNGDGMGSGCAEEITEFFGGGNEAPINGTGVHTLIDCGTGTISEIYGGSNKANITGDVILTVKGGTFGNVYGGSKGVSGVGGAANITGKVSLNLEGGTITNAFGGSNVNGNITDTITVNVLDYEATDCELDITNIYGGSNLADYAPTDGTITSPIVNVMHIKQANGVRGNVFGGGNQATVAANPKVNIGYDNATMADFLPDDCPDFSDLTNWPSAYVTGNVFGGGNEAGATSTVVNVHNGTVMAGVYGGCNTTGTLTGNSEVNVLGGTLGAVNNTNGIVYGGGLGVSTKVKGNVAVTINGALATVNGDVYGGSAKGKVNCNDAGNDQNGYANTEVTLSNGTVNGSLYGGGHGLDSEAANVYGPVTVAVGGGTVHGSVFGGNNLSGTPLDTVILRVTGGTIDSIFGGGNQAAYSSPIVSTLHTNYPELNISGGNIVHKVVGGGNAASITGNPVINISGGNVCTGDNLLGVYGGCNTTGTVTGDIVLNITGDSTSCTTIGTLAALNAEKVVNVHGGGYGSLTRTTGSVTVNFGVHNNVNPENRYPLLYGDLYGGSALGWVNDAVADSTNINILNGSISNGNTSYGGNIYGGGLGDKSSLGTGHSNIAAKVNGKIHVNIGADSPLGIIGKAYLKGCNVFGCNNLNGSPQQDVYVDVYQTAHTVTDSVDYSLTFPLADYAINRVYGGGNLADYAPDDNESQLWVKKVHNTIHTCYNTIGTVYGGGRAAATDGIVMVVDGGRFDYVFGGGNGQSAPANIGFGGIDYTVCSGHVGWQYAGCDMGGSVAGTIVTQVCDESNTLCGELEVEYYFFGDNQAPHYGDLHDNIPCNTVSPMTYKKVFGGSRLANIYGNIYLDVEGGVIDNLFGGSQGSEERPGNVFRFPDEIPDMALWPDSASNPEVFNLYRYMQTHPGVEGTGGNIYVTLKGGTIKNVYGGCENVGNVVGDIQIIIEEDATLDCDMNIDYVYGGNMLAEYAPDSIVDAKGKRPRIMPEVLFKNGTINGAIFGGSLGDILVPGTKGHVTSHPKVVIGDSNGAYQSTVGAPLIGTSPPIQGEGNVYGGGRSADVTGDTQVILQGKATVNGNVYGGGQNGNVEGNTKVIIKEADPVVPPPEPSPDSSSNINPVPSSEPENIK